MTKSTVFSSRGVYVAPECTSVDMEADGFLCQSPTFGLNDWEYDGDEPL